jgi:hypothetical protein
MTIADLKAQRRWVLWRLETVHGKLTKVPYQPSGRKAMANNPATWHTHAECAELASQYSGVGVVLGDGVWGVDIDGCCDAVSGKFTPESREVVIGLDSYGEYSPSGTGCHILGMGKLPGPGLKKPYPGCKAIEVKSDGFYFTFTGRHLSKTPVGLENRQAEVSALYNRVGATNPSNRVGLSVAMPVSEAERFERLMAGDMSDYKDDHSTADFALCVLLAKRHGCNAFKIDAEFRESGLYRDKWERDDYREGTITRAVTAVAKDTPIVFANPEDAIEDDSETEFLVESLEGPGNDGWFPKGELSLIGAPSGVGKTSWAMPMLEKIRLAQDVWGHKVSKPRDYRVLLHDRSKKAMQRTARALHLNHEAIERVIRLTSDQQRREPAEILQAAIEANPGVEVWFIEGLDLWIPDMNKMSSVAPIVDGIQRVATRYDVAVLATVGAPKQKGKDRYFGRDALFGSAALARKVETVVLLSMNDEENPNSARKCWVLPRAGRAEVMYFVWSDGGLVLTDMPDEPVDDSANGRMMAAVRAEFAEGEPIVWRESLGAESTFYRWRKMVIRKRLVRQSGGKIYLPKAGVKLTTA